MASMHGLFGVRRFSGCEKGVPMFCPYCGTQLPDGAAFCGTCGKPVGKQPPAGAAPSERPAPGVPAGIPPTPAPQSTAPAPQSGYIPSAQPSTPPNFNQIPVVAQGTKRPFRVTRGMTIGVLAAAAVVAVAVIAFAVTGIFGGGGANSPEGVANRLGAVYTDLLQSDFDEAALTRFGNDALDLLHPAMVEESIRSAGYHSRDEYAKGFGERYGSAFSAFGNISEYVDFTVDIRVGDKLTGYQLATVNDSLARYGIEATDGYKLGGTMTGRVLRDFMGYSAGDVETTDMSSTGIIVVKIDGSWYLVTDMYV